MADKYVLVTGSSQGIGLSITERLLEDGYHVIGISRRTQTEIDHPKYHHLSLDLSDLDRLVPKLRSKLQEFENLDACISNAGSPIFGHLEQLSDDSIRRGIDLNLTSHLLVSKTVLPFLKRRPNSHLILMGSESSLRGGPQGTVYCAAKFGMRGLAQALRQDSSHSNVHVSIVLPGMVRTPFFDELSFEPGEKDENAVEAEEVAKVVSMMVSSPPGSVIEEVVINPLKKVVKKKDKA